MQLFPLVLISGWWGIRLHCSRSERSTWEFLHVLFRLHHREAAEGLPQLLCNLVGKEKAEISPPHNFTVTGYSQLFRVKHGTNLQLLGLCIDAPAAVGEATGPGPGSQGRAAPPRPCSAHSSISRPSPFPPLRLEDPSTYELQDPAEGLAPGSHPSATSGQTVSPSTAVSPRTHALEDRGLSHPWILSVCSKCLVCNTGEMFAP